MKKAAVIIALFGSLVLVINSANSEPKKNINAADFIGIWNGKLNSNLSPKKNQEFEIMIMNDLSGQISSEGTSANIQCKLAQNSLIFNFPFPEEVKKQPGCSNVNVMCEGILATDLKSLSLTCKGPVCNSDIANIAGVLKK